MTNLPTPPQQQTKMTPAAARLLLDIRMREIEAARTAGGAALGDQGVGDDAARSAADPSGNGGGVGTGGLAGSGAPPPPASPSTFPQPAELGLPGWAEQFRGHQIDAICEAEEAYARGAKVVFLDAPTGSGKSLIAEAVRLRSPGSRRGLYVCTTKTLQDQIMEAFPNAVVLKGRSNYPTQRGWVDEWGQPLAERGQSQMFNDGPADQSVSCADCTWTKASGCRWCDDRNVCPYLMARKEAMIAPLAVLNTAYWLTATNYAQMFRGSSNLVLDEADRLEDELMGQVEVSVSERMLKRLGMGRPEKVTVADSWVTWIEDMLPALQGELATRPSRNTCSPRDLRYTNTLLDKIDALTTVKDQIPEGGWVYEDGRGVTFKPVTVDAWGASWLWRHAKRFLVMSATIISAEQMAEDLGVPDNVAWETVKVPMTFPRKNRPIHVVPVADMTFKNKAQAWPTMAKATARVVDRHPHDRVLVHGVSYELCDKIRREIKRAHPRRPVFAYTNSRGRDQAIKLYREQPGSVLVGPSLDRGVDLPGDLCRVQVICKVPFPNLGDRQISARFHLPKQEGDVVGPGKRWYATQTVRTLVQMTGRGVRSETDHAETYILDAQFDQNVLQHNRRLFPKWWIQALDWKIKVIDLVGV